MRLKKYCDLWLKMINIFYFANNFRTTYIKKNIRKNLAIIFQHSYLFINVILKFIKKKSIEIEKNRNTSKIF